MIVYVPPCTINVRRIRRRPDVVGPYEGHADRIVGAHVRQTLAATAAGPKTEQRTNAARSNKLRIYNKIG